MASTGVSGRVRTCPNFVGPNEYNYELHWILTKSVNWIRTQLEACGEAFEPGLYMPGFMAPHPGSTPPGHVLMLPSMMRFTTRMPGQDTSLNESEHNQGYKSKISQTSTSPMLSSQTVSTFGSTLCNAPDPNFRNFCAGSIAIDVPAECREHRQRL